MRLFYGIDVTDEIRSQLANVQSTLQAEGVRAGNWSRPDLFHLTVLFLGAMDGEHISELTELGHEAARTARPFHVSFCAPGMFERNRILWYGLREDEGMSKLRDVHQAVTSRAKEKPFIQVDERPYRPHLTLARKLDSGSIPLVNDIVRTPGVFSIDPLDVSSICLFESKQEGGKLVYPIVQRFQFNVDA